jgi:pimeloyl-ACP methyl ester carboxylesterase
MASNDITQASIVGHSMGGQVAVLFACEHPGLIRALILIAPAGLPLGAGLLGIARSAFGSRMGGDPRFTPIVVAGSLRAGPRILWQAVQQIRGVDIRPHLASLTVPTLILWGEKDRLLPVAGAATLAAAITGAEVRTVPGANHNLFFDQAELVNEAILGFIAMHEIVSDL